MKDNRYYDLRCLTEDIFRIREGKLKFLNPSSKEYKSIAENYNELCIEREELEDEIIPSKGKWVNAPSSNK